MDINYLLNRPLPKIPEDIKKSLDNKSITKTAFEDKDDILKSTQLQNEVGYAKMKDGSYLVSMVCPMPGISEDMIRWWFWWHPQNKDRYRIWYPKEHIGISYNKKDREYFNKETLPPFKANTHYPVERIGSAVLPLRIDFVTEEDFGFSADVMKENGIPLIVCGHVGVLNNLVKHTEMAHAFKKTDDGLFMISRFWLGKTMNPILRRIIINDTMARGMAEHCCVEYRSLWEILPQLYNEYHK